MGKSKGKTRKKIHAEPYSKGELNKLVDSVVHPLCKDNSKLLLVDGFLHALIEQDPPESVAKFICFNLPKMLEKSSKRKRPKKRVG